mgnify:CR=1 FL=1|jgi:hypothetical protein
MSHLSTPMTISIMVFYSILTFFIGPFITRPFMNEHPDQCVAGFLVGFTLSILLWMKYGRHYTMDGKNNVKMK